nr:putative phage abortive infection protein [uncultured Pedobacter sp.]
MTLLKTKLKSGYQLLNKHVIKTLVFISIILVVFSFFAPYLLTLQTSNVNLQFQNTGAIGDTVGGLMNPFIALSSVCVTFLAFYMQYKANKIQVDNFSTEQKKNNELLQEQLFFRLIENLNQRIVNFSYSETTGTNIKEYSSYAALNHVTKAFKASIDSRSNSFGRGLLADIPERIPNVNIMKILALNNLSIFAQPKEVEDFKTALIKKDKNERWEYLKNFIGSTDTKDEKTLEALKSITRVMFYKLALFEKEELYFQAYDDVYNTYGGFIDGYIKNLHYLLRFIEKNDSNDFFSDYIVSNITTQEFVIIFYYCASRKSGPDFKRLVRKYDLLNDLIPARNNFIDSPSEEELLREIDSILNYEEEEMLNYYQRNSADVN